MKVPSIDTDLLKKRVTTTKAWKLPKEESCIAPDNVWTNKDLDPTPPEYRRWTAWTFFAYWVSDLINPGSFAGAASYVTLGLTWWESLLAILVGNFLVGLVITSNGFIGATVHVPFAVSSRSVFGYWGSKFVIFSRMVIACFWLSINSWSGGVFVGLMIQAIWPQYANLKNSVPASVGATSQDFLSFFLFWLMQIPFILIHPSKMAWVFNVKAVAVPFTALGTLIWAVKTAGPHASEYLTHPVNRAAGGLPRFTLFCLAVTSCQGTWSTLSLNISDFSRYCKSPKSVLIQVFAVPFISSIMSIFGSICAACLEPIYHVELYQPYQINALWGGSAGGRAAMFIASFVWAMANVTTNITANSISAANDMTSLAPKYINIKRGQFIGLTVGVFGFAPWKVLATASNMVSFMASYSIVLAPIAMLLSVDFWIVKKSKINIYELYKPDGIYRFTKGWNWRAYIALACAIGPNMPGMVNAINSNIDIGNVHYLYMLSNCVGWTIATAVYLTLNYFFPHQESQVTVPVHDMFDSGYIVGSETQEQDESEKEKDGPLERIEPVELSA
ncbi:permease for cytosine/purines, uracil, thiamine, allantoin-domain-containing protein [Naematelia encephala]|uniref:Permease for cytosine/purines, uracil, thiamine, allantoin-domain-containing protein n=1 Tax=Naematelia encephala TaxID=71784 RepID=A0A1Y2ADZ2_9TREE|nr:permease for cytosine/purines, uracil, thiamine, allantoin-domain-containing protein [Naematelia encephala]